MTFVEYLKDTFGINEPIYVEEIKFKEYSRSWVSLELRKLVESGELKRFSKGIYYFFEKTPWGDSSPDPRKIAKRRFLTDGNDVYGYVTGFSLLNMTALSTQVPPFLEVATNKESTRVRDIKVGCQRIKARRSRTTITKENARTLQFLDLMNLIEPTEMDESERYMLKKFIKESGITRDDVAKYAGIFPAKATKNMIESGAVYELTQ